MKINKENYQTYFLDYHEGNLDAVQTAELLLFLENNPELKEELKAFEQVKAEMDSVVLENKQNLKRSDKDEIDRLLIAELEGDLSSEEKVRLITIQQQVSIEHDRKLFVSTKVTPDISIQLPGKIFLKREEKKPVVIPMYYRLAAAAAIVLMIGVYFFFQSDNNGIISNTKSIAITTQQSTDANTHVEPIIDTNTQRSIVEVPVVNNINAGQQLASAKRNKTVKSQENTTQSANETIASQAVQPGPELIKQNTPEVREEQVVQVVTPKEEVVVYVEPIKEEFQKQFPDAVVSTVTPEQKQPSLFWQITSAVTKVINKNAKNKIDITPKDDPYGETSGFTFAAGNFKFERVNAK